MLTIKGWKAELHLDFVIFLLCVFSAEGEVIAFRGVLTRIIYDKIFKFMNNHRTARFLMVILAKTEEVN